MEIKVGDVVQLKSGGPNMTVVDVYEEDRQAKCVWFFGDVTKMDGVFPFDALKKV